MKVQKFESVAELSEFAAKEFVETAQLAIGSRGRFSVALAGGSTPKTLYQLLTEPKFKSEIDWSKVDFFWGDERYVDPTSPQSNEGMARQAMLSILSIRDDQIFPMYSHMESPEERAKSYELILKNYAPGGMDLMLLGMGDDGHTASLFPGIPEILEQTRWVVPTISPKNEPQRLTMTIPYLWKSKKIIFLVAGVDKAIPLKVALDANSPNQVPSGIVAHGATDVVWLVDKLAIG